MWVEFLGGFSGCGLCPWSCSGIVGVYAVGCTLYIKQRLLFLVTVYSKLSRSRHCAPKVSLTIFTHSYTLDIRQGAYMQDHDLLLYYYVSRELEKLPLQSS